MSATNTTPKDVLINALSPFSYPIFLQGTMNPDDQYPESFITFWTNYTADHSHFDDTVTSVDWHFSVIFYSSDPALVNTKPDEIITALRAVGFIPQGKGGDVLSDEPTHTGWAMDFKYNEKIGG